MFRAISGQSGTRVSRAGRRPWPTSAFACATALAVIAVVSCGGKNGTKPPPVPRPDPKPSAPDFKEDGDKRAKHMSWEYRMANSTISNRQEVLAAMADEVKDETDSYAFLNLLLNRIPEYERREINLRSLVGKWDFDGPTRDAFRDLFDFKFRNTRDLSTLNNNTHMNLYFAQLGVDQDGKPLVAWTIGETWTLVDVEENDFPKIKVFVKR